RKHMGIRRRRENRRSRVRKRFLFLPDKRYAGRENERTVARGRNHDFALIRERQLAAYAVCRRSHDVSHGRIVKRRVFVSLFGTMPERFQGSLLPTIRREKAKRSPLRPRKIR